MKKKALRVVPLSEIDPLLNWKLVQVWRLEISKEAEVHRAPPRILPPEAWSKGTYDRAYGAIPDAEAKRGRRPRWLRLGVAGPSLGLLSGCVLRSSPVCQECGALISQ